MLFVCCLRKDEQILEEHQQITRFSFAKLMPSPQRLNSGKSVHADFRFPNACSIDVGSIEWSAPRSEQRAVGTIDPAAVVHRWHRQVRRFDGMCSRRESIETAASGAMTRMGVTLSLGCPGDSDRRNGGQSERFRSVRSMV